MLPLALIAAGGANAQTWNLACNTGDSIVGVDSLVTQTNIENTGTHYNWVTVVPPTSELWEVFCWDGAVPGFALLRDTFITDTIWEISTDTYDDVEDPDIVVTSDGFVFIFYLDLHNGYKRPAIKVFEVDVNPPGGFKLVSEQFITTGSSHASSPNIDISDNDSIIFTWADAGSIYAAKVDNYGPVSLTTSSVQTINALTLPGEFFRDPDVAVNSAGDTVTFTYVGTENTGPPFTRRVYAHQSDWNTLFSTGSLSANPTELDNATTEEFGAPRIAAPSALLSSCPQNQCGDDYVVVWRAFDGTDYWIRAKGDWDNTGLQPNFNVNNNGFNLTPCINDRPVVAWADEGIVVAWEYWYDGCDGPDDFCNQTQMTAPDPSRHILIKYLDPDVNLPPTSSGEYSVYNQFLDSFFTVPAIAEGDGGASSSLTHVLYSGWQMNYPKLTYKRGDHGTAHLKRGHPEGFIPEMIGVAYPNPFTGELNVAAESVPEMLLKVTFRDITGRQHPAVFVQQDGGSLTILPSSGLAPGVYLLEMKGIEQTASLRVVKAE